MNAYSIGTRVGRQFSSTEKNFLAAKRRLKPLDTAMEGLGFPNEPGERAEVTAAGEQESSGGGARKCAQVTLIRNVIKSEIRKRHRSARSPKASPRSWLWRSPAATFQNVQEGSKTEGPAALPVPSATRVRSCGQGPGVRRDRARRVQQF
jgi:hypothetical protein